MYMYNTTRTCICIGESTGQLVLGCDVVVTVIPCFTNLQVFSNMQIYT